MRKDMQGQRASRFSFQCNVGLKFGLILSAASTAIVAIAAVLIMHSFQAQDSLQAERTARHLPSVSRARSNASLRTPS